LEPGQTNNNLPNPGNPVEVGPEGQQPVQEQGTVPLENAVASHLPP
jgi:hypothetical protein